MTKDNAAGLENKATSVPTEHMASDSQSRRLPNNPAPAAPNSDTPLTDAFEAKHPIREYEQYDKPHDVDAGCCWVDFARSLERLCHQQHEALERIAWHELTWREARDIARHALMADALRRKHGQ